MTLPISTNDLVETRYYERDQDQVVRQLLEDAPFPKAVAGIVKDYFIDIFQLFDAQCWRKCYGVDVGKEPILSEKFHAFWFGLDPIDRTKRVYETHLPPVLLPKTINSKPFNLATLKKYALDPLVGFYVAEGKVFYCAKNILKKLEKQEVTTSPYWLVMRKGVRGRGLNYPEQTQLIEDINRSKNSNYEKEPSLVPIATVLLTRHTLTSERHLGDSSGMEGRATYSRCIEVSEESSGVVYRFVVGRFQSTVQMTGRTVHRLMIGAIPEQTYTPSYFGIAALEKFI